MSFFVTSMLWSIQIGRMRPRIQEVLEICGFSMLRRLYTPPTPLTATPVSGSSSSVVAILETVRILLSGGVEDRGKVGMLWRLLVTVCVQFDEFILHDVMDRLLLEHKVMN